MKIYFVLIPFIFLGCVDKHDKEEVTIWKPLLTTDKEGYYYWAQKTPELIGQFDDLKKNIKYPEYEKNKRIQGRVFLQVFINETGSIDKTEIVVGIDSALNKAAIDGIKAAKFTPAFVNGKPVKARLGMPIEFKLPDYKLGERYVNGNRFEYPHLWPEYIDNVDKKAEPVGGMSAIMSLIVYPEKEAENRIECKVFIIAYVDELGNVMHAFPIKSTIKKPGAGPFCIAAVNAIKKVKFIPAEKNGKKVKSKVTIPVQFKLE
ncbi:MAG: energy transducer TonB [Ignavibacteriaceae bacterium]|nr:energy transducer TonB [Ignavibacteriaceae bacterium]